MLLISQKMKTTAAAAVALYAKSLCHSLQQLHSKELREKQQYFILLSLLQQNT
jgi:hypothetical protein